MKKQKCGLKTVVILLLINVLWSNSAWANTQEGRKKSEFKKEIVKEFPIAQDGDVRLENKYGNVTVTTWAQNKVKITVTIVAKADDKSKADEFFNLVTIDFNNHASTVSAKTTFDSDGKNWKSWGKVSYEIHYNVSLPNSVDIDITNKYGNIYLDDMKGRAKIDLKYGNLKMGNLEKDLSFQLGYGKADLGHLGDATIEIKYAKMDIESMKNLVVDSKYSQLYIDKAKDIKSETKYDKYHLGNIHNLVNYGKYDDFEIQSAHNVEATAKYSDYDIKALSSKANFSLEYGDVNIHGVSGFEGITMTGKYSDLSVNLEEAGIKFNISGRYTKVKLPSTAHKTHYEDKDNSIEAEGNVGNGNGLIKVNVEYGSVIIYE